MVKNIISREINDMEYVYNSTKTKYKYKDDKEFTHRVHNSSNLKPTKKWKNLHRAGLIKLEPGLRFLYNEATDRYVENSTRNKRKIEEIKTELQSKKAMNSSYIIIKYKSLTSSVGRKQHNVA